jgi:AsmA protein
VKLIKVAGLGIAGVLALGVLLLLFGIPAGPLLGYARNQAEKAGYQLYVEGSPKISLWSSLHLSANGIRLVDSKDTHEDVLKAKQARMALGLWDLLSGNIRVREVVLTQPVLRLTSGHKEKAGRGASTARTGTGASQERVAIDRFTIEDGILIMRDVRESFEDRIDSLELTASFPAQGPLEVRAQGNAGGQVVRLSATASSASQVADGHSTPLEATLELPGLLKAPISFTAMLKTTDQVVSLDGVRGTLGSGRMNGSASVDTAGTNPNVLVSLIFDRLEVAPESRQGTGNEPWSDRPFEFGELRTLDATVKISAREFIAGTVRTAPAEIEANLASGMLSILLSSSELYGGPVKGRLVVDAGTRTPRLGASLEFAKVNALPFLTDAFGFDHLEGQFRAQVDVTASGASPLAIVSSLGGTADLHFADGAVRDVNIASMVRALSTQKLQGWQDKGTEKTDFTSLDAVFRVASGQATSDDLRLAGPLVRVTGKGTANLVAHTLDFRVEPKLVLSLQGQGGPADPTGLGVPVVIRGAWSEPQIYPDVAGILDNPDAAFAKLKAMGSNLLGMPDQSGSGGKLPKPDEVMKSLDQMFRGDGKQPSSDTKDKVRDMLRDLFAR